MTMTFSRSHHAGATRAAARDEFVLISRETWAAVMRALPYDSQAFSALLAAAPCTWDDVEDIGIVEWLADINDLDTDDSTAGE